MVMPAEQPKQPLVELVSRPHDEPLHDNPWTPSNALTFIRGGLAVVIPVLAMSGSKTTGLTIIGAATDADGFLARYIDRHWPESKLGSTKQGKEWDPKADFGFIFGINTAALLAKNSHPFSRLAAAVVVAKQTMQAEWAIQSGLEHRAITGEPLRVDVTTSGKVATAAVFASEVFSTISRDITPDSKANKRLRRQLAFGGLVLAGIGLVSGERARALYDEHHLAIVASHEAETSQSN